METPPPSPSNTPWRVLACPICASPEVDFVQRITQPHKYETLMGEGRFYLRDVWQCRSCAHYANTSPHVREELYGGHYWNKTYKGEHRQRFHAVMSLPRHRSDNAGRVTRVIAAMEAYGPVPAAPSLCDIGTGLGVFPALMKTHGWRCTVVDPDPRACAMAEELSGARAVCGQFPSVQTDQALVPPYNLVSANKVLEHLVDPLPMARGMAELGGTTGIIYAEVPDGPAAAKEDNGLAMRQEFYWEHQHVFSSTSLRLLLERAGMTVRDVRTLREPSGKRTVCAFASPTAAPT